MNTNRANSANVKVKWGCLLIERQQPFLEEYAAGLEHGVAAADDGHVVVLGQFEHLVGGFLVAHQQYLVDVGHVAGAYGLHIAEAGDEEWCVAEGEHFAHEVGGESVRHFGVEIAFAQVHCGLKGVYDFSQSHDCLVVCVWFSVV